VSAVTAPAETLLELSGIQAGYGEVTVVANLDMSVPKGSVVALIGANGAGKTTLLRVASGLLRPKQGHVRMNGKDVTALTPHQRARMGICHIPEGGGVFHGLSVLENLELLTPPWKTVDISPALEAFPALRDRLKQAAGQLSGGERRMLALARAYLAEPTVVLVDEVSLGLAPLIVDQVFESLAQLAKAGISLVVVEQHVRRALNIADSVYLIERGDLVFSGPPESLKREDLMRSYLG
jgi:branched-chain amino acid transport system ATP-binding protein